MAWADAPWIGRPGAIDSKVYGIRDHYPILPTPEVCHTDTEPGVPPVTTCWPDPEPRIESGLECHAIEDQAGICGNWLDLCAGVSRLWKERPNWTSMVRFSVLAYQNGEPPSVPVVPIGGQLVSLATICSSDDRTTEEFAAENLFHYGVDSSLSAVTLELRPSDSALPEEEREHFDGLEVYNAMSVGVSMYGAALYQLARKFADRSWVEPSLSELPYVANATGFDPTALKNGVIAPNDPRYDDIWLSLPPTYLGGMPATCSGSNSPDMCDSGAPTWPIWVPAAYDGSTTQSRQSYINELERQRPGRSAEAALVYLGWALHMIQDGSMPLHGDGTTGMRHAGVDSLPDTLGWDGGTVKVCDAGDTWGPREIADGDIEWKCISRPTFTTYDPYSHSLDEYFARSLDPIFGTAAAPRSRLEICEDLGITDPQIVAGDLNSTEVIPIFQEIVEQARPCGPSVTSSLLGGANGGCGWLAPVRNGLRATAELLACLQPHHLSPALTIAALQPLT